MQVTFFLDKYPCYSETFIQNQIDGLLSAGINVSIIAIQLNPTWQPAKNLQVCGLNVDCATTRIGQALQRLSSVLKALRHQAVRQSLVGKPYRLLRKNLFLPTLAAKFVTQPGQHKTDIIIAHFGTTAVTAAMLQKLGLLDGKLVAVFHGFELSEHSVLRQYREAYSMLFKQARICMPVSQLWAERLSELGCPKQKIWVHHMGINPQTFEFLPADRPLQQPLKLLAVARLVEKKGLEDLLYAVALLDNRGKHIHLTIIGDGPLRQKLAGITNALHIAHLVTFAGAQPHSAVSESLNQADYFVLPSKTAANGDMEGIPVSLMEAMAKGVLVVSTRHSAIPELIDHLQHGWLADEGSPEQLAAFIQQQLSSTDVKLIRQAARQRIEEDFNQAVLLQHLITKLWALHAHH